jgi:glycogen(starch) synthase
MKILMTADPVGGEWRYALELCEALRPYGTQVMLATLGARLSPRQRMEVGRLPNVELRESEYRLEWMASPWASLDEAAKWLLSLEREFAPELIHLNHLVHADLHWRAPVLVVGHSCVLSWWNAVHGGTPKEWSRYHENVSQSLHAAKLIIAPTNAMMKSLQQHYGPLGRGEVIPNGLDPQRFHATTKENIVLSAGRLWDAGKNLAALCAVAESIAWPIFVAGPATSPDGETQRIDGVRTLGTLEPAALAGWYSAASIYALPARYEPFGLTVLEAAFSGCALVLGDIESLREVWGSAARYVSPDDPQALRSVLNELIADPFARHTLAALARARAGRYNSERLAAQYWNVYWSVVNSEDAGRCASYSSITH